MRPLVLVLALTACSDLGPCDSEVLASSSGAVRRGISFQGWSSMSLGHAVFGDGTLACYGCGLELAMGPTARTLRTRALAGTTHIARATATGSDAYLHAYVVDSANSVTSASLIHVTEDGTTVWVNDNFDPSLRDMLVAAAEGVYALDVAGYSTTLFSADTGDIRWSMPGLALPDGNGGTIVANSGTLTSLDANLATRWTKTITVTAPNSTAPLQLLAAGGPGGDVWVRGCYYGANVDFGDRLLSGTNGMHDFVARLDLANGATLSAFFVDGEPTLLADRIFVTVNDPSFGALMLEAVDLGGSIANVLPISQRGATDVKVDEVEPMPDGTAWVTIESSTIADNEDPTFVLDGRLLDGTGQLVLNLAL